MFASYAGLAERKVGGQIDFGRIEQTTVKCLAFNNLYGLGQVKNRFCVGVFSECKLFV